ncbi:MAG: ribbon-helix-helix domain-containing protein [Actinobacteria bacterium]|nr:ribbon-helix-helix domain-containing protein [Actinomycetota bacterium]
MAKPTTRLPRATPAAAPAPLRPAPDNGVPFADPERGALTRPPAVKRRGKQLGARIPDDLYQRLVACAAATRIPQGRLLERALDAELKSHGY